MKKIPNIVTVSPAPDLVWGRTVKTAEELLIEALQAPPPEGEPAHTLVALARRRGVCTEAIAKIMRTLVDRGVVVQAVASNGKKRYYRLAEDGRE